MKHGIRKQAILPNPLLSALLLVTLCQRNVLRTKTDFIHYLSEVASNRMVVKSDDDLFGVLPQDIHEYLLSLGFVLESKGYYVAKPKRDKYSRYVLYVSRDNVVTRMEVMTNVPQENGLLVSTLFKGYATDKLSDVKLLVSGNAYFSLNYQW